MPSANVTISVPLELLADIDATASRAGITRAQAFRTAAYSWINHEGYALDSRNPCCRASSWCDVQDSNVTCGVCGSVQGTVTHYPWENVDRTRHAPYRLGRNHQDGERTVLCLDGSEEIGTVEPVKEESLKGANNPLRLARPCKQKR